MLAYCRGDPGQDVLKAETVRSLFWAGGENVVSAHISRDDFGFLDSIAKAVFRDGE